MLHYLFVYLLEALLWDIIFSVFDGNVKQLSTDFEMSSDCKVFQIFPYMVTDLKIIQEVTFVKK